MERSEVSSFEFSLPRLETYLENIDGQGYVNCNLHEIPSSNIISRFQEIENINQCSLHEIPVPKVNALSSTRITSHVFERSPLKLVSGMKQYVYDENDVEYLDCINGTAHVGHCHPQVVSAAQNQMSTLSTAQGFVSNVLNKYVKELVSSLPEPLSVCYLVNSGSEANDLALRLSQQFTGARDIISMEDSYHGNLGVLVDISFKMHEKVPNYKKPEWCHSMPIPDTYRRTTQEDWDQYIKEFEDKLDSLVDSGRKLNAFMFEPHFVIPGLHTPPVSVVKAMVKAVKQRGGLIIADEVQTGLGRTGDFMWGFMTYEIVPDIITVGKPLGNGYPMGAVLTSAEISSKLGAYFSTFGGNPVSCAIGISVLEIVKNEKLMSSARMVGKYLTSEFDKLVEKHDVLGHHRGLGLVHSLEIVKTSTSKLPSNEFASEVMYGLRKKQILVAITGFYKNIILITPPLCFNMENCRRLITTLDEVLTAVERKASAQSVIVYRESMESYSRAQLKRGIIGTEDPSASSAGDAQNGDQDGGESSGSADGSGHQNKRARLESENDAEESNPYEDMD
eukprot:TRINITY_DN3332_c0_g2_i2.p1 TRINITY_DN3332_c0_g2~~TRINITY_DN3332_c0_g2_i2.p1  ORF type:complete len:563 (-),score=132.92 TRINITY_DN3332_c0_g2_i2:285-1973(-)